MAKAELKTTATQVSVADFIAAVPDPRRCEEAELLDALHRKATGCEPKMWGPSIVGYGSYAYRYESGHSGEACLTGFARGKACLYLKRLADLDVKALEALIAGSVAEVRRRFPQPGARPLSSD